MEKVRRRRRIRLSLKQSLITAAAIVCASTFVIYYYSPDAKVQVLACEGNYLYTDQQIYDMAQVSGSTRIWLEPSFVMSGRIRRNPLVDSVRVVKSGNRLSFDVSEKTVIGYYIKDGKDYMLTEAGDSVEIDSKYLRNIIHFPLLSDFTQEQLEQIAQQFHDNSKYLTREVIAQIAEIVPYKASYDDNMLRITMQDGNVVYSSMNDLVMMTHYEDMLQQLRGQSVCLLLDKENSAINKVACDYLNMTQEERQAYQDQLKAQREQAEQAQQKTEQKAQEAEKQPAEDEKQTAESVDADDWQATDVFDYEYSPSLDLYRDPHTGQYLRWSDESQDFIVVEVN